MAKRGRPRHPDILTPREWEVLALLRERLTNDQIARRLEIAERTAKFHVSEILSKLSVSSREEAARWQPEERPWRQAAFAPLALAWKKVSAGGLATALAGGVAIVAVVGVGVLVWGLLRTSEGDSASPVVISTPVPSSTVISPADLAWNGSTRMIASDSSACGDTRTSNQYGVPVGLDIPADRGLFTQDQSVHLGLEALPYDFVPTRVNSGTDTEFGPSPVGWELNQRMMAAFGVHPNRFSTNELFLRRLDQPSLLFRYISCTYDLPGLASSSRQFPGDPPEIRVDDDGQRGEAEEIRRTIEQEIGVSMDVVSIEQLGRNWLILVAGDGMGPARRGHVLGYEITIYTSGEAHRGERCCIDFLVEG
jgi:DNA-binding CsgD family transcriptional regulator